MPSLNSVRGLQPPLPAHGENEYLKWQQPSWYDECPRSDISKCVAVDLIGRLQTVSTCAPSSSAVAEGPRDVA